MNFFIDPILKPARLYHYKYYLIEIQSGGNPELCLHIEPPLDICQNAFRGKTIPECIVRFIIVEA